MTRWHRWQWLAVAVMIAGCRGEAAEAPAALDACDLVSRGEAAAALGPVAPPAAGSGSATDELAGRSGCAWAARDGSAAVLVELVRTVDMAARVRRTGFSAAARFRAAESRHPEATAVGGVGDGAIWDAEAATLHVLAGMSYLTFEVASSEPDRAEQIALALARPAVDRARQADRQD